MGAAGEGGMRVSCQSRDISKGEKWDQRVKVK